MIKCHRPLAQSVLTAAVVTLALTVSACGAGDQAAGTKATATAAACEHTTPPKAVKVNVLAYDTPAIDAFTNPMVTACSTHKVTVQHAPIDFNGQYTKTPITLAAKAGTYDIVEMYSGAVAQYAAKKQIVNLDALFAKYKVKYGLAGLDPKFLDSMKFGGHLFALPTQVQVGVMVYRKDIFAKLHLSAPKTYADLASDGAKIQKAGLVKYPIALPASDPNTAYEQTLGSLNHTAYLDASGKPTFGTAAASRALTALTNLIPYMDPQVSTFDQIAVQQQLFNGKAAVGLAFSGRMADIMNPTEDKYAKDMAVVAAPSVMTGGYSASSLSADGWAIAANSKVDPDLLFQLMAASVSTANSTAAMPSTYPARTSVVTAAKLPYAGAVQAALGNGALPPAPFAWFTTMEDACYTPLLKALSGKMTVAAALRQSQAAAIKALK